MERNIAEKLTQDEQRILASELIKFLNETWNSAVLNERGFDGYAAYKAAHKAFKLKTGLTL